MASMEEVINLTLGNTGRYGVLAAATKLKMHYLMVPYFYSSRVLPTILAWNNFFMLWVAKEGSGAEANVLPNIKQVSWITKLH
jgi:hypothetical protein